MPRTIAKKRGVSPAGDALRDFARETSLRRIEEETRLPDSIYGKDDLTVVQMVEKAMRAHEKAMLTLRMFVHQWGPTVRAATRAPAASFPPAPKPATTTSSIRIPKAQVRTVSITSPGGGTAQGGGHAPRPTFPPSATSGTGKPAKPKKGSRR